MPNAKISGSLSMPKSSLCPSAFPELASGSHFCVKQPHQVKNSSFATRDCGNRPVFASFNLPQRVSFFGGSVVNFQQPSGFCFLACFMAGTLHNQPNLTPFFSSYIFSVSSGGSLLQARPHLCSEFLSDFPLWAFFLFCGGSSL